MKVSAFVHVDAGPDEVWRRLVAWEDQASWMRDVDHIAVRSENREGVGTAIAARTRVAGIPLFTDRLEVIAWEPPRRIAMAHHGVVRGTGEWRLRAVAGGTRFTWTEAVGLRAPVLGELALLAYRPLLLRVMRRSLAAFAAQVSHQA